MVKKDGQTFGQYFTPEFVELMNKRIILHNFYKPKTKIHFLTNFFLY